MDQEKFDDRSLNTKTHVINSEKSSLDLRTAGKRFLISLRASNAYSPGYLSPMEMSLGLLAVYSEEHAWPGIGEITVSHIEEYLLYLQERPKWFGVQGQGRLSPNYIDLQYRRIRRFFRWLDERDHVDGNPLKLIKHPRTTEKTVAVVSEEDITDLLALVNPANYPSKKYKFFAMRNRAVLYLLGDTPGRREELAGLTMGAVDWDQGTVHVLGKGRKERIMSITYDTLEVLSDYRDARARLKPVTDNLWVSHGGRPMESAWLYQMLKRLGARAHIDNLHTHRFRHTWTMSMLAAGMQERYLMYEAGWAKIPATYFRTLGPEHVREVHRELSPVAKWGKLKKETDRRPKSGRGRL